MKYLTILMVLGLMLTASCTGLKTTSRGLENESFLVFTGNELKYEEGVLVDVDGKRSFNAVVVKDGSSLPSNCVYAISTGTHVVTVTYRKKVIYKQQIFISAQETKKIALP